MNITDYASTQNKLTDSVEKISKTEEFKSVENDYSDLVEKFLANFGKMSEEELLAEILKIVAEKKKDGSFDREKIKSIVEKIAPLLNDEQRAKMKNLLNFVV